MQTVTISLTGLRARGFHGVLEHEREQGQEFVVDAVLVVERHDTADDLGTTVDYGALATDLTEDVRADPVDLIETLASRLVARCLACEGVRSATVTVHKPAAPIDVPFTDVAVTLTGVRP